MEHNLGKITTCSKTKRRSVELKRCSAHKKTPFRFVETASCQSNMIQSIKNDEDLLSFIHNKVENITVEIVTNYNNSMTV